MPAAEILRHFEVFDTPVPVEKIVRKLGVEIRMDTTGEFAGACEANEERAVISVNARDSRGRRRFTMAHELGHILWHPLGKNYRELHFTPSSQEEVEANAFAADLLMPEWMARAALTAIGYEPARLAAMFDVSVPSMKYRLRQLSKT